MISGAILLFLHILCCFFVWLGIRVRFLKVERYLMPAVIFVPVFGLLCCLLLHTQIIFKGSGKREPGVETFKIQEEIYHKISEDKKDSKGRIVSLEEALLIDDVKIRRRIMMDVLNDHPEDYVNALLLARMNEDVEVVHYATTAMSQLIKTYDAKFQKLEQAWKENPGDLERLEEYADFLKWYLEQGIIEGQLEKSRRVQYCRALREILKIKEEPETCRQLVQNEMKLGNFSEAAHLLDKMEAVWGEQEEFWMLRLEYDARTGRGTELQDAIQKIRRNHIYLSQRNRDQLQFWEEEVQA